MKITDIKPILLSYKYSEKEAWGWSGGSIKVWHTALVQVFTDEGIYGLGEMGTGHYMPQVAAAVVDFLRPTVVGQDPFKTEVIYDRLYKLGANWGRRGVAQGVIGGIEMALWDIKGKALNVPVHVLLGGKHFDRIKAYASGGMEQPVDSLVKEVEGYLKKGYKAVKIRGGYPIETGRDRANVKAVRDALGYDFDLMLDAGQGYVPYPWATSEAIRFCDELAEVKLRFIEEPARTDDVKGYAKITAASKTPIAGGENSCSIFELKTLCDNDCVDIIQPDACQAGGIGVIKRAADYAAFSGKQIAPHVFRSGISHSAHLNILSTCPNALFCEHQQVANPLLTELLIEPIEFKDGYFTVPDLPGLGVFINDDIINKYPFLPGTEQRFKVESIK